MVVLSNLLVYIIEICFIYYYIDEFQISCFKIMETISIDFFIYEFLK